MTEIDGPRPEDKALVLDQPWQIELYRLGVFKGRMQLELKGLSFNRAHNTLIGFNRWMGTNFKKREAALEFIEELYVWIHAILGITDE